MQLRILFFLLFSAVVAGCSAEADSTAAAPQSAQPVDVAQVLYTRFSPEYTFTTRLESPQQIELRPRVSGVIESIEFTEGSVVQEGDVLFRIDPRPFDAEVRRLEAELSRARSALHQAQSEAQRARRLQGRNAMSEEQAESRISLAHQRQAELASVGAALEAARLNLEFTEVRAPITATASNAFITAGNNVQAGQSVLTRLVATDRLYAYFDVDERTWNSAFSQVDTSGQTQARLQLVGNSTESYSGHVDFIDNQINNQTGTLRVRAAFDSTSPNLRPGAFARITLTASDAQPRIMVPDRAVGSDLKNRFVLIINAENVLEYRKVELGDRAGALRVIESGLNPRDRIAVNGPARVGPGMPVTPRDVQIESQGLTLLQTGEALEPSA
ncbi:putative Co/Zn/Cd efflux system membrane fusion protein [Marinobacterium lacunae]|uniref:Putative Co/Zn/Cd efflux system membrane fusion protein n=1 Tax=Marinobacterium lacunae TaxID=1232683 RepID=A0A081FZ39_9GAMM|nr:efflux RND transporter periplasmic adaptor subunit [Marinobacterium lacunae]KEA63794.1 putative Co/Zn/Cd efflux system membrane fusion protein [Marinobacterium lacunae]